MIFTELFLKTCFSQTRTVFQATDLPRETELLKRYDHFRGGVERFFGMPECTLCGQVVLMIGSRGLTLEAAKPQPQGMLQAPDKKRG